MVWQLKSIFNSEYADDVSAAAIGQDRLFHLRILVIQCTQSNA